MRSTKYLRSTLNLSFEVKYKNLSPPLFIEEVAQAKRCDGGVKPVRLCWDDKNDENVVTFVTLDLQSKGVEAGVYNPL